MRPILILLCAASSAACASNASAPPSPSSPSDAYEGYREAVERITTEALTRGETWKKLEALCTTAPLRLSGSDGAAKAIEWAQAAMIADGLENVRLEPCTVPYWERGAPEELTVVEPAEHAGERLAVLALGGSEATPPGGLTAEVVAVQSFEELTALGAAAADRFVLFNRPMDRALVDPFRAYGGAVAQRSRGAIEAAKVGASAALVRSMTMARDDVPHTGAMRYADEVPRIPGAALSTLAADRIAGWLAEGRTVKLRLAMSCRWLEPIPSFNVVGELVGRERPDEILVVGGHLDAWDVGQGAHDCGAGCTQSIEALRLLKTLGLRPRRTLRAVMFMNEENGLAGGRTYYRDHQEEMEQHVFALESDRGAFTPRGFTTDAGPGALAILEEIAGSLLAPIGADTIVPGGGGADISPMAKSGVVLAGYLPDRQRYFDLHHTAEDTLDKVHPRELELGTAAIASLLYVIAEMPEPLPRNAAEVRPETAHP